MDNSSIIYQKLSKGCLPRVVKMLVYPPKQASLTVVLGFPYYVGRHLQHP